MSTRVIIWDKEGKIRQEILQSSTTTDELKLATNFKGIKVQTGALLSTYYGENDWQPNSIRKKLFENI